LSVVLSTREGPGVDGDDELPPIDPAATVALPRNSVPALIVVASV